MKTERHPSSARSIAFLAAAVFLLAVACGGGGGDGDGDGECGFTDDYLPYELGYSWVYNVTDLGDGVRTTKTQNLSLTLVTSADFPGMDFIEQTTIKASGSTVSLLRVDGDQVLRYRQEDFDPAGLSERVTVYNPPKLRLDASDARLADGASFDESYTSTVTDIDGSVDLAVTDNWAVVSSSTECRSPFGVFDCVHLRRTRTAGGIAVKDFYFALGIGKVREEGAKQLEELAGCSEL